jgi:ParB-like chromosome segregation protein Spo0J
MEINSITVKAGRRAIDSAKVRELANSMSEIGLINPITVTRDRVLITGAHRLEAAKLLGWTDIQATEVELDELLEQLHEIDENLKRNELHYLDRGNAIKRRDELLTEAGLMSKRGDNRFTDRCAESAHLKTKQDVADEIGISRRVLFEEKQIATNILPEVQEAIKAADLPKTDALKIARLEPEAQKQVAEKLNSGAKNLLDAKRQIHQEEKAERKDISAIDESLFKLINADIRDGLSEIPDNSVDFIITDPPYPREYIPLYGHLSALAARVLKDGGSALVMCGQSYLPQVMNELCKELAYHWTLCYLTPGGQSPSLWQKRTNTFWKPIIWLTKGEYKGDYIGDKISSPVNDNDKVHHKWGQSAGGFTEIVEKFTNPGQTVLDPFLGGGTTGIVCVTMKRDFIGVDIDPKCVETTRQRLMEI